MNKCKVKQVKKTKDKHTHTHQLNELHIDTVYKIYFVKKESQETPHTHTQNKKTYF